MRLWAATLTMLLMLTAHARADAVADAIKAGGVAILMRHASAPGTFDPEHFRLDDCATQRNLSDAGRDEARRIGLQMKSLGLAPVEVLSSQWCRCRETAALAFGAARDWPALNSFLRNRGTEHKQTAEILARIAGIKPAARPLVLVTHQVIITAVTGIYANSGDAVVVAPLRRDGKAGVRVIGTVKPEVKDP